MSKIRVFLSSPMRTEEWLRYRESLIALFSQSRLFDWCDLSVIESESGEPPRDIYLHKVKDCHILLVVLTDDIPAGVQDEIQAAIEHGKPMVFFRKDGMKLAQSSEEFLKQHIYPKTTVQRFLSIHDLLCKCQSSILGLAVRRFEERQETLALAQFSATQLKTTEMPGTEHVRAFAAVCAKNSLEQTAIPIVELALDARPDDSHLFHSLIALMLSSIPPALLSGAELHRLKKEASSDEISAALLYMVALVTNQCEAPGEDVRNIWSKSELVWLLAATHALFTELFSEKFTTERVAEFNEDVEKVVRLLGEGAPIENIDVCGAVSRSLWSRYVHAGMHISSKHLPDVESCINCMPRDSGEWVTLSPTLGTLEELTLENLRDLDWDVNWEDFDTRGIHTTCQGCGAEVGPVDDVYEDWRSEDDEPSDSRT